MAGNARRWRSANIVGVGEAMVEFAPVGDDLYRRGFAGDTLNTCWNIAQLLRGRARVAYATRVGEDAFSRAFVAFLEAGGLDTALVQRDPARTLGLYVISLAGAERSFSYWRESSAARRLADDFAVLRASFAEAALIHVSGITLAVIGENGRVNLVRALQEARAQGAFVSFDPNARMRLWRDADEARSAMRLMLAATDIALPSFDDEALVWGDADPQATLERLARAGVGEIVVKNGPGAVALGVAGERRAVATAAVADVKDTTGAGDAFNAGYLAARFVGLNPLDACAVAQAVAAETLGCFGALAPAESLSRHGERLRSANGD